MSEITDKEIEQLEKEFEEALKAKPKPNRIIVDDKKVNTDAAASLGLHVWNLKVGEEDVVDLFEQKHLPL